jgi:hypothetical protein
MMREDRQRRGQEYADEWRDFSQQPGTHLRPVNVLRHGLVPLANAGEGSKGRG